MSKMRVLLVPSILLLLALTAGAAFGADGGGQVGAQAGVAPGASLFEAAGECQAKASMLATPMLTQRAKKLSGPGMCGSCSVPICRGVATGSECMIRGMDVYTCIPALGNSCSDQTDQCQCWYGPLP